MKLWEKARASKPPPYSTRPRPVPMRVRVPAWWLGIGVLGLAAFFLLGAALANNRLHPDEAYFLYFARNAAVNGD